MANSDVQRWLGEIGTAISLKGVLDPEDRAKVMALIEIVADLREENRIMREENKKLHDKLNIKKEANIKNFREECAIVLEMIQDEIILGRYPKKFMTRNEIEGAVKYVTSLCG